MNMNFTMRKATDEDRSRVAALRLRVMATDYERHGLERERVQARFYQKFDPRFTSIIEVEGYFAGCVAVKPIEAGYEIEHFYIESEYQGKGLGSDVLRSIIAEMNDSGEPLSLAIFKGSKAKPFYEKYGFKVVEEESFIERLRLTFGED
ncbi:GNAT family N-acetyltransferase [Natribacillus halophilus]|uniref:N-acetylglutamate synthase, GNAT family n=1 Tax=Natribacillus halophilus TaxID=549003 RepID=A0A1G8QRE9_9BACI|nr:GNAT family N-acetyltransferase [Natribacillus halophilus]SDJ07221.1 N-acetylglutamate synthase, GNAT family [Natribacillus halophilus]